MEVFDTEEYTVTVRSTELLVELQVQTYSIYEIQVAAFTQKGLGAYSEFVYGGKLKVKIVLSIWLANRFYCNVDPWSGGGGRSLCQDAVGQVKLTHWFRLSIQVYKL